MPICPNCGSYILLGNHSCDCGTTISDDFEEDYEGGRPLRPKDENPYRYDFLNDLYHDYFDILPLEQMDKDIAEIIGVAFGIAFQLLTTIIADVKAEESIAGRSDKQMMLVFLQDIVDTGHALGSFRESCLRRRRRLRGARRTV